MNEDQRQRQMDFILDSMAQLTATTNRLAESHLRDRERIARLENSSIMVTELLRRHEQRHDLADDRMINIEAALLLHLQLIRRLCLTKRDTEHDA